MALADENIPQSEEMPTARPELTPDAETAIHRAVSELFCATVLQLPARLSKRDLAGSGEQQIEGLFVGLWRNDFLRARTGFLGPGISIVSAIEMALAPAGGADKRLPRISPLELPYFDVETILVYGRSSVKGDGAARAEAIDVEHHGVIVQAGPNHGMILPGTAKEDKLSKDELLTRACRMASLDEDAWKDESVELFTIEGVIIKKPIEAPAAEPGALVPGQPYSDDDIRNLAEASAKNIYSFLSGATPSYVMPNCPEGSVAGIVLLLAEPDDDQTIEVTKLELQSGVPLQSTLFSISQAATGALVRRQEQPHIPVSLNIAIGLVYDPAMLGTATAPDLRDLDTTKRAILVVQGKKYAWVFDPEKKSDELVKQVIKMAEIGDPESARIYSLGIACSDSPMSAIYLPDKRVDLSADASKDDSVS